MNVKFDTLTHTTGSIRIANSAYQKWPTKRFPFYKNICSVRDLRNNIYLAH